MLESRHNEGIGISWQSRRRETCRSNRPRALFGDLQKGKETSRGLRVIEVSTTQKDEVKPLVQWFASMTVTFTPPVFGSSVAVSSGSACTHSRPTPSIWMIKFAVPSGSRVMRTSVYKAARQDPREQ
jgi:hypothetical protein